MNEETNFITIGSLSFSNKSIGFIIAGCFLLGLLAGLLSVIHIDNPGTPLWMTLPILFANIVPILIIVKGLHKAEVIN